MIPIIPFPEEAKQLTIYHPTDDHPTYTPDDDVRLLIWLASQTKGPILEIGCNQGVTTFNLAIRFPKRTVLAVDWTGTPTMSCRQVGEQPSPYTACLFASWLRNVKYWDISLKSLDSHKSGPFGFIFIDGDHQYENCKHDTELALQVVESGGIVAWHDYPVVDRGPKAEWIGVPKVVHELAEQGMKIEACAGTMIAFTRVDNEASVFRSR